MIFEGLLFIKGARGNSTDQPANNMRTMNKNVGELRYTSRNANEEKQAWGRKGTKKQINM